HFRNRDAPCRRDLSSLDLGDGERGHGDVGGAEYFGLSVARNPFAGAGMLAVGLAHPVQHQFVASVEMQREPVPSALIGGEWLAAPLAIEPGLSGHVDWPVVDGEDARRRIMRLAVLIGGLLAQRIAAVAAVAL